MARRNVSSFGGLRSCGWLGWQCWLAQHHWQAGAAVASRVLSELLTATAVPTCVSSPQAGARQAADEPRTDVALGPGWCVAYHLSHLGVLHVPQELVLCIAHSVRF